MRRNVVILAGIAMTVGGLTAAVSGIAGSPSKSSAGGRSDIAFAGAILQGRTPREDEATRRAREHAAMLDRDYPLHGWVTGIAVTVRTQPDLEATTLGWLRSGAHVRLGRDRRPGTQCATGWYPVWPRGWVCAGQGIEVGDRPSGTVPPMATDLDRPLPYRYWYVKERQVPEWHLLPSREHQRAAAAHAARYLELLDAGDLRRAERLRAGELPGEPPPPPGVARWLDHGFFVASTGVEVRAQRRFVRTVRGSYVKEAQLEERTGSSFQGVELGPEQSLPIAWTIRAVRPLIREPQSDGTIRIIEDEGAQPIPRLSRVHWLRRERIGDQYYHAILGPDGRERWLRDWFVTVAEQRPPPDGVADDEPWVHVDLSSQTLVLYRGASPIYATLVSTGLEDHPTPEGEFIIRRKLISDTMANLGPDAGDDRYRIDDVPWAQYFHGAAAIHGVFWHGQFGLPRSHGCVNLSPRDAQYVFRHTWPEVPEGWHGISTEQTGVRGSRVVITR